MINQETKENTDIVRLNDSLQKLSFDQLIRELGMMKLKLGVIIPLIFEKGKEKGFNEIEIRNKVKKAIDMPERTLNRYLPENAKLHKYPKHRELANSANYNQNIENFTVTKASNEAIKNNKSIIKSDSEPAFVYRGWTLEELISRYEEIEIENDCLDLQLAYANTRIEDLEEYLEQQGLRLGSGFTMQDIITP